MSKQFENKEISGVSWKPFLVTTAESILVFYLASFCLGLFIVHRDQNWISGAILVLLYLFVMGVCAYRIAKKLSLATIMLIIPVAPFIALALFISLIPVLQFFKN